MGPAGSERARMSRDGWAFSGIKQARMGFPSRKHPGQAETRKLRSWNWAGWRWGGGEMLSPVLAWRGGGGSTPARMASMSSAEEARRTLAQLSRERVRARLQVEPEASGLRPCAWGAWGDGCGPGSQEGGELGATSARRSSVGRSPATWLSMVGTSSRANDSLLGAAGVRSRSTSTTTAPAAPATPAPPVPVRPGRPEDSRAVKASMAGSFRRKVLARPVGRRELSGVGGRTGAAGSGQAQEPEPLPNRRGRWGVGA